MNNQVIKETIGCDTAEQFLSVLSPIGENFKDSKIENNWLFRGQGQDYPLIPSLLRSKPYRDKVQRLTKFNLDDYSQLIKAEIEFLVDFFEIADKRGLVLPDDSQYYRYIFEKLRMQANKDNQYKIDYDTWGTLTKTLSVMALAQHYGVPTRLLDWTRNSYIAAFFAAKCVYDQKLTDGLMVVWSFYFPNFNEQRHQEDALLDIRGVTAPSATNLNLKAQQGVFTLVDFALAQESEGNCLPLDKALKKSAEKFISRQPSDTRVLNRSLQKITLPVQQADKLLFLLAKLDITPSSVFPGYGSIVLDLEMRQSFAR